MKVVKEEAGKILVEMTRDDMRAMLVFVAAFDHFMGGVNSNQKVRSELKQLGKGLR